jgi:hypothetical protein
MDRSSAVRFCRTYQTTRCADQEEHSGTGNMGPGLLACAGGDVSTQYHEV